MAKESLYGIDLRLLMRETFNSESDTRANGGTPNGVTFSDGKGNFDGGSSKINYISRLSGTYSIRVRFNCTSFLNERYLFDMRGSNNDGVGFGYLNTTTGELIVSTGTRYVNGSIGSFVSAGVDTEVIITGITLITGSGANLNLIGSAFSNTLEFLGDIDLFEIYKGTLTADEVELLYENALYREPNFANEILSLDSRNGGIYDKWGNPIENNGVDIVRDGSIYTKKYNGVSSHLDFGDNPNFEFTDGAGNDEAFSVIAWIKMANTNSFRIISKINGPTVAEWFFATNPSNKLGFVMFDISVSNSIGAFSVDISNMLNKWICVVGTYSGGNSANNINIYINGINAVDSRATSSYTSMKKLTGLVRIGRLKGSTDTYSDGKIAITKVIRGELNAKQIAQYYNSTKKDFN